MMMELRHLRYFVAVAEELHFGRAASRLHIVQPALSMQIRALEEELGAKLLRRDRRQVELTEAGRLFLVEARCTLDQAARAADVARRAASGSLGRIRIGYSASAIHSGLVSRIVRRFRETSGDVEIVIDPIHPWRQCNAVLAAEVDVAFGPMPDSALDEDLLAVRLAEFPVWIALAEGHRLASLAAIDPPLLKDEPFILYAEDDIEALGLLDRLLGFYPHAVRRVSDLVAVLALVEAGQGVSVIPSILSQAIPSGLVFRPMAGLDPTVTVALLAKRQTDEPVVTSFVRTAQRWAVERTGSATTAASIRLSASEPRPKSPSIDTIAP